MLKFEVCSTQWMRILVFSDIHDEVGLLKKVVEKEPHDIVVIAGDFTYYGSVETVRSMLKLINSTPIIYVPGNTDPPELIDDLGVENTYNIHGRLLELLGLKFVGVGGSLPTPFRDTLRFEDEELREILKRLETVDGGNLVFVSHSPPYMILDRVYAGFNVGSKAIRDYIVRVKPLLSIHGHVHEARGVERLGPTTLVNPGPLMRGYYAVVRLPDAVELKSY